MTDGIPTPEPRRSRRGPHPVALTARVVAGALTAWLVPRRYWMPITRTIGRFAVRLERASRPTGDDRAAERVAIDRIAAGHAARLHGLGMYRPRSRPPPIELRGADRLQRSLNAGNGAILWVARFAFAPLFFKIALHDAGFAVSHLSRPTHGFDASPFAVRWLNPIWNRIEERYVHERIVIEPGEETAALRTLRRRLADNRVVSITVGDEAVRTVEVPFLDGSLRLATGPANLAASSGAPLLPVFVIRRADSTFVVEIEEPLDTSPAAGRDALFTAVATQYAERLAPRVRDCPGQWIP